MQAKAIYSYVQENRYIFEHEKSETSSVYVPTLIYFAPMLRDIDIAPAIGRAGRLASMF